MKRIIRCFVSVIMAMTMLCCFAGCGWRAYLLPEYESGYYRYAVKSYNDGTKDGTKVGYIMGLTELGKQQTELIIPIEIDGIPIKGMGYREGGGFSGAEKFAEIESEKLRKIYFTFSIKGWNRQCVILEPYISIVQWRGNEIWNMGGGKRIVGYNILKKCFHDVSDGFFRVVISNVAYMINYEKAENDGYYWVDSYENGLIEYIPPEPTREGYVFKGWYKEAECINAWDFEKDRTGEEIPIIEGSKIEDYDDSDITFLYAKWEKE